MPKIYESPDKGKTVYAREIGSPVSSRTLVEELARKVSKTWSMEQD